MRLNEGRDLGWTVVRDGEFSDLSLGSRAGPDRLSYAVDGAHVAGPVSRKAAAIVATREAAALVDRGIALATSDENLLESLFHPESHWRDVLALSWNIQTVNGAAAILREMPAQARRAVHQARQAGFRNLSLDLIYAVPYQTVASWQDTLQQALLLEPEHLSCYCLTVEEGTPLHRQVQAGRLPPVVADEQHEFLEKCQSVLTGAGFHRYEVSSWSRPGFDASGAGTGP